MMTNSLITCIDLLNLDLLQTIVYITKLEAIDFAKNLAVFYVFFLGCVTFIIYIYEPTEEEENKRKTKACQDFLDRLQEVQEQQLKERLMQEQELHDRLKK